MLPALLFVTVILYIFICSCEDIYYLLVCFREFIDLDMSVSMHYYT